MSRRRKKRLAAKYIVRRALLFVATIALVGVPVWFFANHIGFPKKDNIDKAVQADASVSERVFDSEPDGASKKSSSKSSDKTSSSKSSSKEDDGSSSSKAESDVTPEPEDSSKAESEPEPEPESKQESSKAAEASTSDWRLLLVNYQYFLPQGFEENLKLVTITENYRVDERIADDLNKMRADAKTVGVDLKICSAYRSVAKQTELHEQQIQQQVSAGKSREDAEAVASTIVAKPGTSEHHTGLALDIVTPSYQSLDDGFERTLAFEWLNKHAHEYGFVLRFPKDKGDITKIIYEPWHYRYVGKENAAVMKSKGICLEEYVEMLNASK